MTVGSLRDVSYVAPNIDRIPPNNVEAEMAVLGSMLVEPELVEIVRGIVVQADFYAPLHETVFATMVSLHDRGAPIDKVSLAEELRLRGMLDKIGGLAYLTSLMDTVPTASSVTYYATLVREKAQLRALIHAGAAIAGRGYEGEEDVGAALLEAERLLAVATASRGESGVQIRTIADIAQRLEQDALEGKVVNSMSSPWDAVNQLVGNFMGGELILWPSAPGVGKSGLVAMLADWTAAMYGAVALFAIENGDTRTTQRILALRTGISARKQRLRHFAAGELSTLIDARQKHFASKPFYVFGRETNTLAKMWRALRMIAQREPLRGIVVDHVGKLHDVRPRGRETKNDLMNAAYEQLIDMAIAFDCPVHVVQHLNRDGSAGEPSIETINKIRDGGNPEGHADAIIFPWRAKPMAAAQIDREAARLIVAKSRDGDVGAIDMRYVGYRNMWLLQSEDKPWFERGATALPAPTFFDDHPDADDESTWPDERPEDLPEHPDLF